MNTKNIAVIKNKNTFITRHELSVAIETKYSNKSNFPWDDSCIFW